MKSKLPNITFLTDGSSELIANMHTDLLLSEDDLRLIVENTGLFKAKFKTLKVVKSYNHGFNYQEDICEEMHTALVAEAMAGNTSVINILSFSEEAVLKLKHSRTKMVITEGNIYTKNGVLSKPVYTADGAYDITQVGTNYVLDYYDLDTRYPGTPTGTQRYNTQGEVLDALAKKTIVPYMTNENFSKNHSMVRRIANVCDVSVERLEEFMDAVLEGRLEEMRAETMQEIKDRKDHSPLTIMRLHAHYGVVYLGDGLVGNCFTGEAVAPTDYRGQLVYNMIDFYGIPGNDVMIPFATMQNGIHDRLNRTAVQGNSMLFTNDTDEAFQFEGKSLMEIKWWKKK